MTDGQAKAQPDSTQQQRAEDLHERALIGGLFYVLSWLLVSWQGGAWTRHPGLAGLVTGILLALALVRLVIRRWSQGRADRAAASLRAQWTVLLATAALWGGLSGWALWDRTFANADNVTLLATAALAMAFAQIFAVNKQIALVGTGMLFLPMLSIVALRYEQPGVAMVLVLNLIYLVAVIARSHREYEGKLALESALREQRDRFATLSRTDALTGLSNRGHFQQGLEQQVAAARADGSALAVAFLIADLDHFKSINDRYGHAAGDRCLREVATRLRECFVGSEALVARLGGEEFGVLVAGEDVARIAHLAEAFRASLERAPIALPDGSQFEVTVSVGLAQFSPETHRDGDALYAAADEALYRAKKGGRNRIEAA
ncbi:diguanylate cyclase domain-containing protein [Arenimonas sp. MALMAid1274]|uniref:GGDEF domain-containing protein n=1 Tax=Arenimonas sp. MALMAid1274 TaxID=3411630 RepID=UPI003BA11F8D